MSDHNRGSNVKPCAQCGVIMHKDPDWARKTWERRKACSMECRNILVKKRNAETVLSRFWSHVDKTPGLGPWGNCWEWRASTSAGYGQMTVNTQHVTTHTFSYRLHIGEIPKGLCVCHRCDNRLCVRPDHFFLGTRAENLKDMWQKGRAVVPDRRGSRNGCNKLNDEKVRDIRRQRAAGIPHKELAAIYGVTVGTIQRANNGRAWNHIK